MSARLTYQRDEALRTRINKFLQEAFNLPADDYYAKLDVKKLLGMKAALSDINNVLTMRLTLGFVEWAGTILALDTAATSELYAKVLISKPSANGYDVYCSTPVAFVAEVKCNLPVNGGARYGAAQRKGILRDLEALRRGKSKARQVSSDSLKFMVFLDIPQVRGANEHFLASMPEAIWFLNQGEKPNDPSKVYGVYVSLVA